MFFVSPDIQPRSWLGELISTTEVPPLVLFGSVPQRCCANIWGKLRGFWVYLRSAGHEQPKVSANVNVCLRRKKQIRWIPLSLFPSRLGKKNPGFSWSMDSTVTSKVFHPPVNAIGELPHTWDVTYRSSSLRPILPAQQKSAVFLLRPWFSRNDHCCISPSRSGVQFRGEPTFYYPGKFSGLEPWKWGGEAQVSTKLGSAAAKTHDSGRPWFLVFGGWIRFLNGNKGSHNFWVSGNCSEMRNAKMFFFLFSRYLSTKNMWSLWFWIMSPNMKPYETFEKLRNKLLFGWSWHLKFSKQWTSLECPMPFCIRVHHVCFGSTRVSQDQSKETTISGIFDLKIKTFGVFVSFSW